MEVLDQVGLLLPSDLAKDRETKGSALLLRWFFLLVVGCQGEGGDGGACYAGGRFGCSGACCPKGRRCGGGRGRRDDPDCAS
jgi:hypothetical protein